MKKYKRIFFTGIKGVGMASLAVIAKERGVAVVGSDVEEEFPTDRELHKSGICVLPGFSSSHIENFQPDLVVYTGAHGGADNPQVLFAKKNGIPVMAHGKALGMFMDGYRQVSVAGCHGKTTTASMLASVLKLAGKDPTYAIGAPYINGLGFAGHSGAGNIFVAEADEYVTDPAHDRTPRFLWQKPEVLIVTNIDYDHPDVYKTFDELKAAYIKAAQNVAPRGRIIFSSDDPQSDILSGLPQSMSVGFQKNSAYVIQEDNVISRGGMKYRLDIQVPGIHNMKNAAMAAAACEYFGISGDVIERGLAQFAGAGRRFEILYDTGDSVVIDDYAHHPAEIQATLSAAKERYPGKRIIAVFQPHTVSRTKSLLAQFATSFISADEVYILPIFTSAREISDPTFSSHDVVRRIRAVQKNVYYVTASEIAKKSTSTHSVFVFMGAGDIYRSAHEFVKNV